MSLASVLVIGGGGREHALARALKLSAKVGTVYCAPGNAGTAALGTNVSLDVKNHSAVLDFVHKNNIQLTVIGPEAPLVDGLSNALRAQDHAVVGASQQAAQLEGSKIFAKEFMTKYEIPTADYRTFTNAAEAKAFVRSPAGKKFRVLKADGLAAGKGVIVASSADELIAAIGDVLEKKKFGQAGEKILLEETLKGPEISVIALTDGKTLLPFPASQDHKRVLDSDKGPNTGGMGAYAPTPFFTDSVRVQVDRAVAQNFLRGVQTEGFDFRGIIYFGLMLTKQGPKVLEFNVRLGDPEAEAVLPLIQSDLYDAFMAVAQGSLANIRFELKAGASCTVVMASGGYPDKFDSGFPIDGLSLVEKDENVITFHAGTKLQNGRVVTAGGRVLTVTGLGKNLDAAVVRAYQGVKKISFTNAHFRKDIAAKALKNKSLSSRIGRMKKRHQKLVLAR